MKDLAAVVWNVLGSNPLCLGTMSSPVGCQPLLSPCAFNLCPLASPAAKTATAATFTPTWPHSLPQLPCAFAPPPPPPPPCHCDNDDGTTTAAAALAPYVPCFHNRLRRRAAKRCCGLGGGRATPQVLSLLGRMQPQQLVKGAIFDLLTGQCDRHAQNIFLSEDGRLRLIDNEACLNSWGHCSFDSVLVPTSQKFEIVRVTNAYVLKQAQLSAPPKAANPQLLLDYRCHVPGGQLGVANLPPRVKQCLGAIGTMTVSKVMEYFGLPSATYARFLLVRARGAGGTGGTGGEGSRGTANRVGTCPLLAFARGARRGAAVRFATAAAAAAGGPELAAVPPSALSCALGISRALSRALTQHAYALPSPTRSLPHLCRRHAHLPRCCGAQPPQQQHRQTSSTWGTRTR